MDEPCSNNQYAVMEKQDVSFFKLIPQTGVKHKIFSDSKYNAAWDILADSKGRVFFSKCAELGESVYVRLYEYLPETNAFKLHFRLEDITFQQDIAIRASKIHTSMAQMNDGRLIMATHTTSQSPMHPAYMPMSFYHHQFEGFQGSNIIIYNPDTGEVDHRGIPVPFESIYGGAYDPKYNAYYFTGMMRMHAYRFDIAANEIKDLGQLSESAVYKLAAGPDGHIYSSTKMGRIFRLNVDEQRIEDLGLQLPLDHPDSSYRSRMQIGQCKWHPNGKLYFCATQHPHLFAFDPKTMKIEDLGDAAPEYGTNKALNRPSGITIDSRGVVWYAVTIVGKEVEAGCRLYSYDVGSGAKNSWGFLGSELRALHIVSEMDSFGDMLYVLDSNHQMGSCGILAVDLSTVTKENMDSAPYSNDAALYMCAKEGRETYPFDKSGFDKQEAIVSKNVAYIRGCCKIWNQNPSNFNTTEGRTYKLWQRVGAENSQVRELQWLDNDTLNGVCGQERHYTFTISDRELTAIEPMAAYTPAKADLSAYKDLDLPYINGRQYRAVATAAITLFDGSVLIGTEDAMLALYRNGTVFSLGQAAAYGPVKAFSSDHARKKVYGIASYPMDVGGIFSFDHQRGVRQEGHLRIYSSVPDYYADSCEPSAVAVSPDGRFIAFGCEDRLGVVYICRLPE